MTSKRTRFSALFMALLFAFTSVAVTIAVIVDQSQQSNKSKEVITMLQGSPLKNFTPVESISELRSEDTIVGTGELVQPGDTVTTDYTGAVAATGIVFQSSIDSGEKVTFPLSGVITGWTEAIPGMKAGGTRRLFIPAEKAYGSNPPQASGIPANADLVFDVTVYETKR